MKTPGRTLAAVAALAMSLLAGGCIYVNESSSSDADLPAVTNLTRTGTVAADLKLLEVENRFGFVHVRVSDGEPNEWSWKLIVHAKSDAAARQWASAAGCAVEQANGTLRLAVDLPQTRNEARFESDFEIRVPKAIAVHTRNQFGETRISGTAGAVEAAGQNGLVEVRDAAGPVRAETSFADLTVENVGAAELKDRNGRIDAATVHGSLDAETTFASLDARDIGGPVTVHDQNGSVTVSRVKGSVRVATSFSSLRAEEIEGDVTLANQNGSIEVSKIKGDADLRTSFASLDARGIGGAAVLVNQNGRVEGRDIGGSTKASTSFASMRIESAGRHLICRNQNGSIELRALSAQLASIDAQTSFASLEVRMPAEARPAVQAQTSFADIESDFPVLMKPRSQDAFADVSPETPRVILHNQNGRIRIVGEKTVATLERP